MITDPSQVLAISLLPSNTNTVLTLKDFVYLIFTHKKAPKKCRTFWGHFTNAVFLYDFFNHP